MDFNHLSILFVATFEPQLNLPNKYQQKIHSIPEKISTPPPKKKKNKIFPPKTPGRPFALCPPFCLLSNIASNSSKASDHCEERSMTLIMEP